MLPLSELHCIHNYTGTLEAQKKNAGDSSGVLPTPDAAEEKDEAGTGQGRHHAAAKALTTTKVGANTA